jgi:5-methylcytosine-specific restriction endonuclease McrA
MPPDDGAIAFAERLLLMLDEGRFSSTYKYAVLLALLDLCLEHTDAHGAAPPSVTTVQVADKVLELYWPHAVPFAFGGDRVLQQNRPSAGRGTGQAAVVRAIQTFREKHAKDPSAPLSRARAAAPEAFAVLRRTIEWKLVEMPLPRLQTMAGQSTPFVYVINWDASITRTRFECGFDNLIRFVQPASEYLVRLSGLLRPLVQRQWAAMVARLNDDIVKDAQLEGFLFGVERISLEPVRAGLRGLQEGRCFYCAGVLGGSADVDHFVPWARYANNAIENLVVADARCNNDKRDFLASAEHVARWAERNARRAGDLAEIARQQRWDARSAETLAVARAIYLRLPSSVRLWRGPRELIAADGEALHRALAAA